ncbi:hypothetical protein AcV5_006768 [Taiwanofungus camphoratus]|nr:hypothetical protein AcV5_006768 [Antrodia cinnamomea]
MVVLTQRLAMRSMLRNRQTLTAAHDISNAWNGLGSAFLSLWRQTYLAACAVGIAEVTLYLVCISVLHISTPSLFSMETFNQSNSITVTTTVGMPLINYSSLVNPYDIWADSSTLLPYLGRVGPSATLGLNGASLYDILAENDGVGDVLVGAWAANATCGFLPNATAVGTISTTNATNLTSQWTVTAAYDDYDFSFDINLILWNNAIQAVDYSLLNDGSTQFLGRNIIFVLTTNVTDTSGSFGSNTPVQPPMYDPEAETTVYDLQLVGCTLSWVPQTAIVDAQTRFSVSTGPSAVKNSSNWGIWTPIIAPNQTASRVSSAIEDGQVDAWGDIIGSARDGTLAVGVTDTPTEGIVFSDGTDVTDYLLERLGMNPQSANNTNIALHDLENALANVTSTLVWAASNVPASTEETEPDDPLNNYITLISGQASAGQLVSRLNLNIVPASIVSRLIHTSMITLIFSD